MAPSKVTHLSSRVPRNARAISILLLLVAVVNSTTMGYDGSMMNGLNILPQYKDYFQLDTATTGLNTGATWIGSVLGALLIQPLSDRLGRRHAILIAACTSLLGCIVQSCAHNIATFVIGRIFIGIGSELASGPGQALIAEILPANQRGPILGLNWTYFFVGSLTSSGVNYGAVNIPTTWAWRLPSVLQCVPSLVAITIIAFVPESPRWLIKKGRYDEAREILAIVYGKNDVDAKETVEVFEEIRDVLDKEKTTIVGNPFKELIKTKANRHRLAILVSFGVMVEMFGNYVISYYLGDMLDQAGITNAVTQLEVNVILNCWAFVIAVAGSLLVDVCGRRMLMLSSIAGMTVTLYLFGGLSKAYGSSDNTSAVYGTIAVIFLFQGFYAFGVTPLTSAYPAEFLPFTIRPAGIAVFRFLDSCFGLMASFAMSYAMANLGWKFYMINASWNIIFFFVVYFVWVETRRIPLEQVAIKFGDLALEDIHHQDIDSDAAVVSEAVSPEKSG